jgi:hypothetical protein
LLHVCSAYTPPKDYGYGHEYVPEYDGGYWGGDHGKQIVHMHAYMPEMILEKEDDKRINGGYKTCEYKNWYNKDPTRTYPSCMYE